MMDLSLDLVYSLIVGLLVIISLLALLYHSTIIRVVDEWITWYRDIKHLRSLPSPPLGHWLWGHASEIGPTLKTMMYMQENHRKYPKWCVYWIGPFIPFVFTADVEIMKIILQQPGESPRPPSYRFFYNWLGDGLFTSSGTKWRRRRKMLTPAFHFDILKQYIPVYNEVSHKLVEIWSGMADSGESVEITEYLHSYTLDVLLRCMYSSNSNCLEKEEVPYVMANNELAKLMIERVFTPHYAVDWIYFNTTAGRQFLHYCDVVHKFSEGVIVQRRELLKVTQPIRRYKDFLDVLLSTKDDNGEGLTDTEIREEVDTFMLAGYETTATALGWTLYCLAMYKEHQEVCRKEIREVLAGRDYITWEDLSKLSYTTMCIKESLRLYPVSPFFGKKLSEDVVGGGYRIPKGTWVGIGIHAMHHDPAVWHDPEKYDPLRFATENGKEMDPFAFLAFSAGPRNCIGLRFALHEMKATIAHIINKFDLELDTNFTLELFFALVYKPKDGIKMKFSYAT